MKKTCFVFLLLTAVCSFAQKQSSIPDEIFEQIQKGNIQEALIAINKANKKTLETTTLGLYKKHLEKIQNFEFHSKKINYDSTFTVSVRADHHFIKFGIYDSIKNKYIISPVYDEVVKKQNRKTSFYQVTQGNKKALLDSKQNTIVPFGNYENIIPFSNNFFIVRRIKTFGYWYNNLTFIMNNKGEIIFDNLNSVELYNEFNISNIIQVQTPNYKYQILDLENQKILFDSLDYSVEWNEVYYNNEDRYDPDAKGQIQQYMLMKSKKGNFVYHTINGEIIRTKDFDIFQDDFNEHYFLRNELSSLINYSKNILIHHDDETPIRYVGDKYIIVRKNDKYGIFNLTRNRFYKEAVYDSITPVGNTFYKGKWINLIYDKEIVSYDKELDEKGIVFRENGKLGLMDFFGKIILEARYDDIIDTKHNSVYNFRKGKKWGFVSLEEGSNIVKPNYDYFDRESYYVINAYRKNKITHYDDFGKITEPESKFNPEEYKEYINERNYYFDVKEIKEPKRMIFRQNDLYGFDDVNNNEIVPAIYTYIEAVNNNRFLVRKDSLIGVINENGKEIIPAKYRNITEDFRYSFNPEITDKRQLVFSVEDFESKKALFGNNGETLLPFTTDSFLDMRIINDSLSYFVLAGYQDTGSIQHSVNGTVIKPYAQTLVKIENQKLSKVPLNSEYVKFLYEIDVVWFTDRATRLAGFHNLKTGKTTSTVYRGYIELSENSILTSNKTGELYYNVVLDSLFNETLLDKDIISMVNGNFFYTQNNLIGVMNKDFEPAKFKYPILKTFLPLDSRNYSTEEFKQLASDLFLFGTKTDSKKLGLIDFSGKIIIKPDLYDQISIIQNTSNIFKTNEYFKQYKNGLYSTINRNGTHSSIVIFTDEGKKMISFDLEPKETWSFGKYANVIIIKNLNETKIIHLNNPKNVAKLPYDYHFKENADETFEINLYNDNLQTKTIYNSDGKILFNKTFDRKKGIEYVPYNEYIIEKNGKFGVYNGKSEGKNILFFDELQPVIRGNCFIAKQNNKYGVISYDDLVLLNFEYDQITQIPSFRSQYAKQSNTNIDLLKIKKQNKEGLINLNNFQSVLPVEYDTISVNTRGIQAKKDTVYFGFHFDGNLDFKVEVDSIKVNLNSFYQFYKNGKEVFMTNSGELTDENPLLKSNMGYNELLVLKYCIKIDDKYYLPEKNNKTHKTPIRLFYTIDDDLSEEIEGSHKFFIIQDENDKYGLYDTDLNQILPFEYEYMRFVMDLNVVIVQKQGKTGVIDLQNKIKIPIIYDSVDFNSSHKYFKCSTDKNQVKISPNFKIFYKEKI